MLTVVGDGERVFVVALAITHFQGTKTSGKKFISTLRCPCPAQVSQASLDVERKSPRRIATQTGLGHLGEQTPDVVIKPYVGGRI